MQTELFLGLIPARQTMLLLLVHFRFAILRTTHENGTDYRHYNYSTIPEKSKFSFNVYSTFECILHSKFSAFTEKRKFRTKTRLEDLILI